MSWESKLAFIWVFLSFQLKLGVLVLLVQEQVSITYMRHCTQNIPNFNIEYRVKCQGKIAYHVLISYASSLYTLALILIIFPKL